MEKACSILGIVSEANCFEFLGFGRKGIAFFSGDGINVWVHGFLHPPQHVIEGAVLHNQNNNGFDGMVRACHTHTY
ncbi:hypothetical protein L484_004696 [Morus notabilis]|uniref:Uncharacterized protein n=1 Tax=Morus notabilis TaxID=981085 RepID=W9S9J2_9ROSA|nr:hypothetical protein L484_004696 [Morus notabilis]